MEQDTTQAGKTYRAGSAWLGLAAVYVGFLTVGFVFHFLPPILPAVIGDLDIGRGAAGLLMSLFALPGILLSLPGGWLVDRYGERLVGGGGLLVMGLGTLALGLAPSFNLILAARVLSGCGAMVGVVALQRLVIRLFTGRGLGLPLGVSGSALPIGIIVVLNTAGPVALRDGWRAVALRVGGATIVAGLVFLAVVWSITRGRALGRSPAAGDVPLADPRRTFRPIWIGGVVWFCANGAMTAFMTFAPDHYLDLGFGVASRGLFTSIPMWTSAALGMVTGWLTDRHGGRALFMAAGMALMGIALGVLPAAVVSPALIGLALGVSLAAVVTPTIALPGALLPASHTGRGYGILATCANLGIFLVPPLAGLVRDTSGGYLWPFLIMAAVAAGGVVAGLVLRRGRFVPGWSRRALLPAVLLLGGCGHQDRYSVVAPVPEYANWTTVGEISVLRGLPSGGGLNAAGAWSLADVLLVGPNGTAARVQGDRVSGLDYPGFANLVGVLCDPDGSALVLTYDGAFSAWRDGVWSALAPLPERARWLGRDDAGRPLALSGFTYALYRFADGAWTRLDEGSKVRVSSVWSAPGVGTWAVTYEDWLMEVTADGLVPRGVLPMPLTGGRLIAGDADGNLVCGGSDREFWVRENGVWTHHFDEDFPRLGRFFWSDGVLYGIDFYRLLAWDGRTWTETDQRDSFDMPELAVDLPSGPLLVGRDGRGYRVADGALTQVLPAAARPVGAAVRGGDLYVYVASGDLYRADTFAGAVWHHVGRTPDEATVANRAVSMAADDRGRLVMVAGRRIWEWDGTEPVLRDELALTVDRLFPQPDGELLFATGPGLVSLRGGHLSLVELDGYENWSVCGARRRSPETYEVMTAEALYRGAVGRGMLPVWYPANWGPEAMVTLDAARALVLGDGQVRELDGDQALDVTPLRSSSLEPVRATLAGAALLDDGRLLSWNVEAGCFILREGAAWSLVQPQAAPGGLDLDDWWPTALVPLPDGSYLAFGRDLIVRFDPNGGAP